MSDWMKLHTTGLAIDMKLLNERQAQANHYQSLDRLNERGGLSPAEALAICENRKFFSLKERDATLRLLEIAQECVSLHPDDQAVDRFAAAMKLKLAKKRDEGKGGWEQCDPGLLSEMLIDHIGKGDPVDVANFCMMLHQTGNAIDPELAPSVLVGYANSARIGELDKVKAIVISNEQDEHFNVPVFTRENNRPDPAPARKSVTPISLSELMPTEADEDCFGKVLAREVSGGWGLWMRHTLLMRPEAFTHWTQTGVVLPAEPAPENSSASKFGNEKWST